MTTDVALTVYQDCKINQSNPWGFRRNIQYVLGLTWKCLTKRAATMKLRAREPRIMELQNCSSHTDSRLLTWTRYRQVTWRGVPVITYAI
jgi:hypothetical protein